jgi:hypothetical protein
MSEFHQKGGEKVAETIRLAVDDWSNPRFARIEDNFIAFEVMGLGCACSTCLARLDMVKNCMETSDVKWFMCDVQIPERGETGLSTILVVEPSEMPEKVDSFLGNLLGLQIRQVA